MINRDSCIDIIEGFEGFLYREKVGEILDKIALQQTTLIKKTRSCGISSLFYDLVAKIVTEENGKDILFVTHHSQIAKDAYDILKSKTTEYVAWGSRSKTVIAFATGCNVEFIDFKKLHTVNEDKVYQYVFMDEIEVIPDSNDYLFRFLYKWSLNGSKVIACYTDNDDELNIKPVNTKNSTVNIGGVTWNIDVSVRWFHVLQGRYKNLRFVKTFAGFNNVIRFNEWNIKDVISNDAYISNMEETEWQLTSDWLDEMLVLFGKKNEEEEIDTEAKLKICTDILISLQDIRKRKGNEACGMLLGLILGDHED